MAVSRGYQDFILDLLGPLAPLPRRMFSGVGLFHSGVMFGLLVRDTMYLRVDDMTRERFECAGSVETQARYRLAGWLHLRTSREGQP